MRRRVVGWSSLLVTVAVVAASAQAPPSADAYSAAVRAYAATGDAARAFARIQEWPLRQLERVVENYATDSDAALDKAAIFQLEIGLGLAADAPGLASQHMDLGDLLLKQLRVSPRHALGIAPEQLSAFAERWYLAAASVFLWVNNPRVAGPFISRGLQVSPGSAELRLMEGIEAELESASSITRSAFVSASQRTQRVEPGRYLFLAKSHYQKLVKDQSGFAPARVRLGRLLWILGEVPEALIQLTQARLDARDPKQQYLASLFLGALHEQQGRRVSAREAYEAALKAASGSQAATVALGHLDVLDGRPDRAQARARALLVSKRQHDAWWTFKNGGVDEVSVRWLRAWATR